MQFDQYLPIQRQVWECCMQDFDNQTRFQVGDRLYFDQTEGLDKLIATYGVDLDLEFVGQVTDRVMINAAKAWLMIAKLQFLHPGRKFESLSQWKVTNDDRGQLAEGNLLNMVMYSQTQFNDPQFTKFYLVKY
ncbi:MAG: hypothetical protein ACRCXZ_04345 [Patescibacteria group bacterium]